MVTVRTGAARLSSVVAFLSLLACGGCGGSGSPAEKQAATTKPDQTTQAAPISTAQTTSTSVLTGATTIAVEKPPEFADTIAEVRSGVVRINVRGCEGRGSGTGIIISPTLVATVEHVINGASRITLERSRNILGQAEVIGFDRDRDLALLRLKKPISGYRFRFAERQ